MGIFNKKKTTQAEAENVAVSLEQTKKKAGSVKVGANFMQEKYDSIMAEEVAISTEIRNIQKNFSEVTEEVGNLSSIIIASHQSIDETGEIANSFQTVKEEIAAAVSDAKTEIDTLKESSNQAISSYQTMKQTFASLQESVDEIKQCMTGIIGVANQTNLLSLNASIEAARAGEAGKGFAIVAEQVRQLSDEIKKLTSDVEQSIAGIESSTAELNESIIVSRTAVEASGANVDVTYELVDKVNETAGKINEVYDTLCESVDNSKKCVKNIEEYMESSKSSYDRVAQCIEEINTHENKKGVMYEDLYNVLQQLEPIAESINK